MLKKLLVLSVVGIALAGCNEEKKEVTADMLIGKWMCTISDGSFGKRYNSEGKMIEAIDGKEFRPMILEYQKMGSKLVEYHINSGGNKRINASFELSDIAKSKLDIEVNGERMTGTIQRNYISGNEFQHIMQGNSINIKNNFVSGEAYLNFICKK